MDTKDIPKVFRILRKAKKCWVEPFVTEKNFQLNPFKVLVSCLLSLRTRDVTTMVASKKLFALADTPQKFLSLKTKLVEQTIYPVSFFRNKTCDLFSICRTLIKHHDGKVPNSLEQLLDLKGVGRKTANLTLIPGYGKMGICVDTHVHRVTNRWGYVVSKSPDTTEMILRSKLPKRYWKEINNILVSFGQNICKPLSPFCSKCCISDYCGRVGVKRSR